MNLIDRFLIIDEAKKTITLKENTTKSNIFVKLFLSRGYTVV